jgi:hypothetical protein
MKKVTSFEYINPVSVITGKRQVTLLIKNKMGHTYLKDITSTTIVKKAKYLFPEMKIQIIRLCTPGELSIRNCACRVI